MIYETIKNRTIYFAKYHACSLCSGHNYVKFGFTMAFATTVLAWGAVSWPEAFNIANQLDEIRKTIKWATDYFIKCHVSHNVLYGQIGEFYLTETFWGRPEELPRGTYRPAYKIDPEHPGIYVNKSIYKKYL